MALISNDSGAPKGPQNGGTFIERCASGARLVEIIRRLGRYTERTPDGCWRWTGSTNQYGYGRLCFTVDGKPKLFQAHRLAYEVYVGPIAPRQIVMHTCDNRDCVNPAHLRAATQSDNIRDAVVKGRHRTGWKESDAAKDEAYRLSPVRDGQQR